ncbi:conserved hypothetical protein [Hahella chejuensis KCTC 2396]|uniref:Peptidoglycan binding-like domain-containing protein n=1 Tax=Hahella chejuensis (strain KCTC 2396) TaxID=349521 RepID=Q2SJV2_HAHCH|nr:M15 family metallopeptidase [Hahella chejuensis]ABC29072.1 conserved hypothetical protein [Hahella chejuensis KCTC 2396]
MLILDGNYIALRQGDSDTRKTWGGEPRNTEKADYVKQLQEKLSAVKAYSGESDGEFGPNTAKALRFFQWTAKEIGLESCSIYSFNMSPTGVYDINSYKELDKWVSHKAVVGGDLVRIKESSFSNIELGPYFKKIEHPNINDNEFVVSLALAPHLVNMNKEAKKYGIIIKLNQTLRLVNTVVSGSVVTPAKKSQHFIGHAIDCNLMDGDNWNSSATFSQGKESENAKKFIASVKAQLIRWGGDFQTLLESKDDHQ